MTRRENIENYLQSIAQQYVPISHTSQRPQFVRLFEDVKKNRKYKVNTHNCTMLMLSFAERKTRNGSNIRRRITVSFAICRTAEASTDQSAILSNTEAYADEIEAKIINDFVEGTFSLGALETDSFSVNEQEVEIEGINLVGHIVEFSYTVSWLPIISPSNWQTI